MTYADKTISLFKFLRGICAMRSRPILSIDGYEWTLKIRDIPDLGEFVRLPGGEEGSVLASFAKPGMLDLSERAEAAREIFASLYQKHIDLERETETLEIISANGFFFDREAPAICHPLLTARARTRFDPWNNSINIEDTDAPAELNASLLQQIDGLNLEAVKEMADELDSNGIRPFDEAASGYLELLSRKLSSESAFSSDGVADGWAEKDRFLICVDPILIIRTRPDNSMKAIDNIIAVIESTGHVPSFIRDVVSGGEAKLEATGINESLEDMLAAANGEDRKILLSKAANREQLEIARRIEDHSGVLVQGPPGTGKTHTIANLLGHFLAEGKSVLVTSHTRKALSVLKDKLSAGLRSLCVSVIDESNKDMEKSVDSITDFMASHSSHELRRELEDLVREREGLIDELAAARREIFNIMCAEAGEIVIDGTTATTSEAAAALNVPELEGIIPGGIASGAIMPLTYDELRELYSTNAAITADDERDLIGGIPAVDALPSASELAFDIEAISAARREAFSTSSDHGWKVSIANDGSIAITAARASIKIPPIGADGSARLRETAADVILPEEWMIAAASDGSRGGVFKDRWQKLASLFESAIELSAACVEGRMGREIIFDDHGSEAEFVAALNKLRPMFEKNGKVSRFSAFFDGSLTRTVDAIRIDGAEISSPDDCDLILKEIELRKLKKRCSALWHDVAVKAGASEISEDIFAEYPEAAEDLVRKIRSSLSWKERSIAQVLEIAHDLDMPIDKLLPKAAGAAPIKELHDEISKTFAKTAEIVEIADRARSSFERIDRAVCELTRSADAGSAIAAEALGAIREMNDAKYGEALERIRELDGKSEIARRRESLLSSLAAIAPKWADAIRIREEIHGADTPPSNIHAAWKVEQCRTIITELEKRPYDALQEKCRNLGDRYKKLTAACAEKSAWCRMLERTESDIDMKQTLQGWKQTVKKIGKGTGKNAAAYRAKARELMARCQNSVPVWIMPVSKVLESLDPAKNRFDIVIIDEASQSDITELAALYTADKAIIVGDDRQVSPMGVGIKIDQINALQQMFIKDRIPNAHLYDAGTSIYDIAATTFHPLILREHFRCVPDIISFSSRLSYDGKMTALRDPGSTKLLPSVVVHTVEGAERAADLKENRSEARAIVALIRSCIEQKEYADATFGVISMLGTEQSKLIQSMILSAFDPSEIDKHKILCGIPANFQGDERDVIFLSLVDSPSSEPLKLRDFGASDAIRKRYNVAASRACDQLWVVTSLDPSKDLKPGDIRKTLIDHSNDPKITGAAHHSASRGRFEETISSLIGQCGHSVSSDVRIGNYLLDTVVSNGITRVAIECDGERGKDAFSSIIADMEEQSVLERAGWRFIRVRGSEFYHHPQQTLDKIIATLNELGIAPNSDVPPTSDLLARVRTRAETIAEEIIKKEEEARALKK